MASECQSVSEKYLKAKAMSGVGDEPNTKTKAKAFLPFQGEGSVPGSSFVCVQEVEGWGWGWGVRTCVFVLSNNKQKLNCKYNKHD